MNLSPRRHRLAAAASLALLACAVHAQSSSDPAAPGSPAPIIERTSPPKPAARPRTVAAKPASEPAAQPSALTADLFYEILMGELTTRSGDPGSGYALVLDAARRLRDGKLFQRAVEIALQSRSGDAALAAARAWQEALPTSRDARRIELQILIALNRISETVEPLRAEVAATSQIERPLLMAVITRNYSRASDKKLAASVVEQALVDELKSPTSGGMAWATVGRLRLNAGDASGALEAARKGQEIDPASDAPAALALEMIDPGQPLAEPIVTRYLNNNPKAAPDLRIAYARVLVENRRYGDASTQLQAVTTSRPDLAEPWLLLGSLQMQAKQDAAAEGSLKRFIELSGSQGKGAGAGVAADADRPQARRVAGLPCARATGGTAQGLCRRRALAGARRRCRRVGGRAKPPRGPAGAPGQAAAGARSHSRPARAHARRQEAEIPRRSAVAARRQAVPGGLRHAGPGLHGHARRQPTWSMTRP
jgi:tetratricopeptide (TPR) repeat protein